MEKSEFRVLIKRCFPMGKTPYRRNSGLINVLGNLLNRGKWLRNELVILNDIVRAQMLLNNREIKNANELVIAQITLKKLLYTQCKQKFFFCRTVLYI